MKNRILHLKPVAYSDLNDEILAYLNKYKSDNTEIEIRNLSRGPSHLEYLYYQAVAETEILREIRQAERDGFDAAMISCFDDPGLFTAREISQNLLVTAAAESSVYLAATLGDRFSVIVGRDKWIPQMRDLIARYGLRDKLASFRSISLGVLELHRDKRETASRIRHAIENALIRDKAEVIILGCTMQYGFFEILQEEYKVPIIDSMLANLKYTEYLLEVKQKTGWTFSRRGMYERPPDKEMADWGLT